MSGTINVPYLNIRLSPYIILYKQKYFILLYNDIQVRFVYVQRDDLDVLHFAFAFDMVYYLSMFVCVCITIVCLCAS
jgi:hypothetical protein